MMGIVKRAASGKYVLVVPSPDDSEDESDEPDVAQPSSYLSLYLWRSRSPSSRGCTARFIIAHLSPRAYDRLEKARECCGSPPDRSYYQAYDANSKPYRGDCSHGRVSYSDDGETDRATVDDGMRH